MPHQNWEEFRTRLKEVLREAAVRKLIEQNTDISARTLARWVSGETEEPDRKRLVSLVQALPQHRDSLVAAIAKALPDFESPLLGKTKTLTEELPLDFWIRLLETNATTPKNIHFATIIHLVLLQLEPYVDPERVGVQLIVAQCSPPASPGQAVRSLREVMMKKTHQSLLESPGHTIFLGAESLAAYSVSTCRAVISQSVGEEQLLPVRQSANVQSVAAYPIQRGGSVAGCFLASSPLAHFFTEQLQSLLQIYAHFLVLAFETDLFYDPQHIRILRPMPQEHIQYAAIRGFEHRVMTLLQHHAALTRFEAETAAWQEIEAALLALGPQVQ